MANNNKTPFNNDKSLRIIFWNTRSIKPRREEIQSFIQNVDICICVESWLKPKDTINYSGFLTYRKDRPDPKGGGIIFFIRKNLAYIEIKDLKTPDESIELCGIRVNNVNPPLDVLACYRSPGLTLTQSQWDALIKNINFHNHCLLMGDFNAHNVAWNFRYSDSNGKRFHNAIENNHIFLHNNNSITHIDLHKNTTSNLDLVISTTNCAEKVNVEVCDETWGSDQFPIFVNIDLDKYHYNKKTFKLKSTRTNWDNLTCELNKEYNKFLTAEYDLQTPSEKYLTFVNMISTAIKNNTPRKK